MFFKIFMRMILVLFTFCALGIIVLVIIYFNTNIPQPQANAAKQVSIVYYSDGKTELGRFSTVNREDVKLNKVPAIVQYEFLSAEDRNFYKNSGVSISGTARAAWSTLSGGEEQGGSTITQQYVKNYFLTQDRSVTRKVKEIMIAIKIDHKYSKQKILQDYLNNIYFGRGAYGIQAASQAYFGINVDQLNDSQGAFLASAINAPGIYDPQFGVANVKRANARMVYVFDGMVKEGWMTKTVRDQQAFPTFKAYRPTQQTSGPNVYIVNVMRSDLQSKLKLSQPDIDRGGLRITTTIEKLAQDAAVSAVTTNVPSAAVRLNQLHTGLIAEKPNGAVVAMYGGEDVSQSEYNSATQAKMQGGSSFKIFALAAALQDGMTLNNCFLGSSPYIVGHTRFANDNNEQFGSINLANALAHSVNTAFIRLNQALGTGTTLAAAQQLGIPSADPGMDQPNTSDVLGTASVSVIDMANAFSTVSAQGKKASPYFIQKVDSVEGDYSYIANPQTQQVLNKGYAADIVNAASHVLTDPGATAQTTAGKLGRPAGGKTGTSSAFKSAWFTGFTPNQLTASVGMYAGDGTKSLAATGSSFYGGDVPAIIWLDFMKTVLKGQFVAQLPKMNNFMSSTTCNAPPVTQAPSTQLTLTPTAPITSSMPTKRTTTPTQVPTPTRTTTPTILSSVSEQPQLPVRTPPTSGRAVTP